MCTLVFYGIPIEFRNDRQLTEMLKLIQENGWAEVVRIPVREELHYPEDKGGRVVVLAGDD